MLYITSLVLTYLKGVFVPFDDRHPMPPPLTQLPLHYSDLFFSYEVVYLVS